MKAAIITLHRVYNYGSALQAYATQIIFERLGYETEIIDYITPQRTMRKLFLSTPDRLSGNFLKRMVYRTAKIGSIYLKERTFGRFARQSLNLTQKYITVEALEKAPPKADIYVSGSDQIWNSDYNKGVDRGFFLDFIPDDGYRISFVSSFGKTQLNQAEADITAQYLKKYKAISVREESALKMVENLGGHDAVCLVDPTLQIDKEQWLAMASPRLIKEKYLILMLLYNEDNHATEYARAIADQRGLELVKLSWEMRRPPMVDKLMTHRSPADFLSLFHYADFVVTNSFHGLAFSINFERQFIVVPRNEYNSRIDNLLRLTGLTERLVESRKQLTIAKKEINYAPVRDKLEVEKRRVNDFLCQALPPIG